MRSILFVSLLATTSAACIPGMFGTLPPHPVVKVQNNGSTTVCRVERQADGYDVEPMLAARDYDTGRDGPIAAGTIREFELPRPAKNAPPLEYTMRFWTCAGAPLPDKRITSGANATIAVP
ncbi:MAG: hypothetical protein KIT31_38325 [Deltaproteobacteria bacterium]|nr:hypothetical protein [Deltaproteobacteria bacterium]